MSNSRTIRRSDERGHSQHGWLESYHTFSFGNYYDLNHMGFKTLRVINDDTVLPGKGFGKHAHQNMEIISYVVEGELEHKDSMGNGSVLRAGSFQVITAGSGIEHSEFNPSNENTTRFLQIWIRPDERNLEPSYQEVRVSDLEAKNGLTLVAANTKRDNLIQVNQNVRIYHGQLKENQTTDFFVDENRSAWIQIVEGAVNINGEVLNKGDAVAIETDDKFLIKGVTQAQFLIFDLG